VAESDRQDAFCYCLLGRNIRRIPRTNMPRFRVSTDPGTTSQGRRVSDMSMVTSTVRSDPSALGRRQHKNRQLQGKSITALMNQRKISLYFLAFSLENASFFMGNAQSF
jgi:hypothetical protein